ncbi:tyrosine-type recombinase/integrase [Halorubrum tebenquichense]|uniref:tyrosine-type recombinase/integrase n=1 Tax=Halorubrum tebenquichense TaxID=119434 RepID=UPI001375BB51|nr:tyrosine-type recombinase/integrase [Halorubrum tebenquichense]
MSASDDFGYDDVDLDVLISLFAEASQSNLEPLSPEEGLKMYKNLREDELTPATLRSHQSRLQFFLNWCDENGITNLNELSGRDLQKFRNWRKDGLSVSSLETNMRTLRLFLQKCVKFDGVQAGIPGKVEVPSVSAADNARDELVSGDQAEMILQHLNKYEYGSIEHVVWLLLAAAGLRISALQSLDVVDYTSTHEGGKLTLKHRVESGTRLKNAEASERVVHLPEHVANTLEDYLSDQRPDVTDANGREPLIASKHGRIATTTIRKYVYKWTRPCMTGQSCPHGKTENEVAQCDAMQTASDAYKCPSSSSPHTVRRGYITHELDAGVPMPVVSDRCDVGSEVIEEHYDERSDQEKMRLRKEVRESVHEDGEQSGYGR